MNDIGQLDERIRRELMIVVEQVVRPVRASFARKRRMREELLAHLAAIHAEEAAKPVGEHTSLENAKRRFGDPRELSRELQQTVGRWDRLGSVVDKLSRFEPGESLLYFATKCSLVTVSIYLVIVLALLPFSIDPASSWVIHAAMRLACLMAIVSGTFVFVFVMCVGGLGRALFRNHRRRYWWLASAWFLGLAGFLPSVLFLAFWVTSGSLAYSLEIIGRLGSDVHLPWYFAVFVVLVVLVASRRIAIEMRHVEEWASLRSDSATKE